MSCHKLSRTRGQRFLSMWGVFGGCKEGLAPSKSQIINNENNHLALFDCSSSPRISNIACSKVCLHEGGLRAIEELDCTCVVSLSLWGFNSWTLLSAPQGFTETLALVQGTRTLNIHNSSGLSRERGGRIVCVLPFSRGKKETHKQNSQRLPGKCQDGPGIIP